MLAFSESNLDPHKISPFVNEFAMEVLITGRKSGDALPTVLRSSSTIKHTGIVHLERTGAGVKTTRFERLHPTSRPNGARFPLQCTKCNVYFSWKVPQATKRRLNQTQSFKCSSKGCSGVFNVPRLEGYRPMLKDLEEIYWTII